MGHCTVNIKQAILEFFLAPFILSKVLRQSLSCLNVFHSFVLACLLFALKFTVSERDLPLSLSLLSSPPPVFQLCPGQGLLLALMLTSDPFPSLTSTPSDCVWPAGRPWQPCCFSSLADSHWLSVAPSSFVTHACFLLLLNLMHTLQTVRAHPPRRQGQCRKY